MGLVLEVFQNEKCRKFKDYTPDFDTTTVDEKSRKFYNEVSTKLEESEKLIETLRQYASSQDSVRESMKNPTAENQRTSFEAILKNVETIKTFYNYCNEDVVKVFQSLRVEIERVEDEKIEESEQLKRQEAWAKQLAQLIGFVVHWDQLKMREPALLNDFSYYKRNLSKQAKAFELDQDVEERQAGFISFWLAESMPMCKTLGESLKDSKSKKLLKDISELCCSLVKHKKFTGKTARDNEVLCLRCAVGCIVLYDRAAGGPGAFGSKTFRTKPICSCLASFPARFQDTKELCDGLKNVIRYGCQSYGQYASSAERRCCDDS